MTNYVNEIWKAVVGYEGIYSISSHGRLRREISNTNTKAGRITTGCKDAHYMKISLSKNGIKKHKAIHQVMAEAFIGKLPKGYHTNHKDSNKLNNNISNLEYITAGDNIRHSAMAGTHPHGARVGGSKLTDRKVLRIKDMLKKGTPSVFIAKLYGVSKSNICQIKKGEIWKHLKRSGISDV